MFIEAYCITMMPFSKADPFAEVLVSANLPEMCSVKEKAA